MLNFEVIKKMGVKQLIHKVFKVCFPEVEIWFSVT